MPYTLQRKMFKLGGSAAHGGGITANLKDPNRVHMKKGGSVAPIGLVGKGPLHMKGPDGKMREMQNPLALLTMGASRFAPAFMRALSGKGIGSLKNYILGGSDDVFKAGKDVAGVGFGRGKFNPATGKIKDVVIKKGKPGRGDPGTPLKKPGDKGYKPPAKDYKPPTPDVTKTMNRDEYIKYLKDKDPAKLKELFGDYGFGTYGRMSQIGRGAQAGLLPAAGVGAVSSLFPEFETGKDKPIRTAIQTLREAPELAFNLVAGVPSGALGLLAGQGGAGFLPSQALQNTLYPDGPKDIKTVAEGEEITQAKVKEAAEDDLRAEYERLLGGKPNPVGEIGSAIATALPSLAEDDLTGAASAYTQQLKTGVDKMDEYDRGVGQFILQNKITEGQTNQAMIAEALASGDLDTVSKIKKYQAAAEELGDVTPLPVKGKNKPDYDSMRAGTVYADVTTSTGSKYLAINRSGDDELRTNSADAAVNFANA